MVENSRLQLHLSLNTRSVAVAPLNRLSAQSHERVGRVPRGNNAREPPITEGFPRSHLGVNLSSFPELCISVAEIRWRENGKMCFHSGFCLERNCAETFPVLVEDLKFCEKHLEISYDNLTIPQCLCVGEQRWCCPNSSCYAELISSGIPL